MNQRNLLLVIFIFYSCLSSFSQKKDEYHLATFKGHSDEVLGVAFSPDGKQFTSTSKDKSAIIWDIATGEKLITLIKQGYEARPVHYNPKTGQLYTGVGKSINIYTKDGVFKDILGAHSTFVWDFDIHKDGILMVSGSYDKTFALWDLSEKKRIYTFKGHDKSVLAVAISPNAKYVASGSLDQTIRIWNVDTKETASILKGHSDNIYSLCFSNTGEYLLSASRDRTVKLWDVSSGKNVMTYLKHQKGVMKAIFTPDDNHIITASLDGTINIIEVRSGKLVYSFVDHEGPVNSIDLSNDGKYLLSCGNDKTVILWDFSKKIFAEFAYPNELQADIDDSYLFRPRKKGEDKEHYERRQEKAKIYLSELYDKYYQKYIAELQEVSFSNK